MVCPTKYKAAEGANLNAKELKGNSNMPTRRTYLSAACVGLILLFVLFCDAAQYLVFRTPPLPNTTNLVFAEEKQFSTPNAVDGQAKGSPDGADDVDDEVVDDDDHEFEPDVITENVNGSAKGIVKAAHSRAHNRGQKKWKQPAQARAHDGPYEPIPTNLYVPPPPPPRTIMKAKRTVKTYVLTYGTASYQHYVDLLVKSVINFSEKSPATPVEIRAYSPANISNTDFARDNKDVLSRPRGAGYWLWKPYIIQETMKDMEYGDVIVYCDSKYVFETNPAHYLHANGDFKCVLEKPGGTLNWEHQWTKWDAYVLMNVTREKGYRQAWAGLVAMRKTPFTEYFVKEWLRYATDKRIITDDPSVFGPEMPYFSENRHDQTVFSLLVRKLGLKCGELEKGVVYGYQFDSDAPG